jgi:hypothetical protein
MADHQQDEIASATAAKGDRDAASLQSRQEQRMQDMLEDDDVREALRLLHADKPRADRPNPEQEKPEQDKPEQDNRE